MISDSVQALLVKRGASSLVGRAPEERGPEESSYVRVDNASGEVTPDLIVGEKVDDTEAVMVDLSTKDRRKLRREGDNTPRLRIKRPRDSVPRPPEIPTPVSFKMKGKGLALGDDEEPELDALVESAKLNFEQVTALLSTCSFFRSSSFSLFFFFLFVDVVCNDACL